MNPLPFNNETSALFNEGLGLSPERAAAIFAEYTAQFNQGKTLYEIAIAMRDFVETEEEWTAFVYALGFSHGRLSEELG